VERVSDLIPAPRLLTVLSRGADAEGVEPREVQRVVQPAYRGSAAEVFLPLLMILRQDPAATVVVFPVHGASRYEAGFLAAVGRAADAVSTYPDLVVVIGMASPFPSALGWIEPGAPVSGLEHVGVRDVRRFVRRRRPVSALGAETDGLVNTGVVTARADALLALGRRRLPDVVESLEPLVDVFGGPEEPLLREAVYEGMPYADLSHAFFGTDECLAVFPIRRVRTPLARASSA
jgi:mannose-1-phosphate guanylyltransferase